MRALLALGIAVIPAMGWAQERYAVPTENAIEAWRTFCINYYDDYKALYQDLETSGQFKKVEQGWFSSLEANFDVGVTFHSEKEQTCTIAFMPTGTLVEIKYAIQQIVFDLDGNAIEDENGFISFSYGKSQFELMSILNEKKHVISFALMKY